MLWIIGFLTAILVLDSLFLILLVLVQLPKKEAGLGQAFGASATDALFGAGSGNALTKMTKYSTGIFFVLTLIIYMTYNHHAHSTSGAFGKRVQQAGREIDTTAPSASDANKAVAGKAAADGNNAAAAVSNATAGQLGTKIGTNVPAPASIPETKNTNLQGLLTVPQAAPKPAPSEAPKPTK
jgi:protein translocase SecG subunit